MIDDTENPQSHQVALYLEGVEKHLVVHLDQPGDSRHLCVRHSIENDVVDTEQRHQHQCGLQQFSGMVKKIIT